MLKRGLPGSASAKSAGYDELGNAAALCKHEAPSVAFERRVFPFCAFSFVLPAIGISLCVSSFPGPLKVDCWPSQALVEVGGAEAYY